VTRYAAEDVSGFRVPEGKPLGCAQTGKRPHGIALSPDGARVYVSNEGSNSVAVVDAATMKKVSEVLVGREPNQIALSPKGDRLWVTNHADATVSVISTATRAVEKTIPVGREPHVMTTSAARNAAIITAEGDDALDLFDLTTLERVGHVPVVGFPRVLAVTPDGATAFLTPCAGSTERCSRTLPRRVPTSASRWESRSLLPRARGCPRHRAHAGCEDGADHDADDRLAHARRYEVAEGSRPHLRRQERIIGPMTQD
jgi:YVTN family beta-propeller protein